MIYDTRYIIEGWHYRLLILDLYLVFVENVSLARRLSAAKSQKDFLRLQKQADRYQKRAYKKMHKWGIPKDCESFAIDKTLYLSSVKDRHGVFAFISKDERRDLPLRRQRSSVRAQLKEGQSKKTAAPKKAAAKTKDNDLEV